MMKVKKLPQTVRVRAVDYQQSTVDLTGHRLRLTSVDHNVFLRANAINNGLTSDTFSFTVLSLSVAPFDVTSTTLILRTIQSACSMVCFSGVSRGYTGS